MSVHSLLRSQLLPHIWCPGCGHGIIMGALLRAIVKLDLDPNKIVLLSGIGCAARAAGYMDFHTIHTLHGRAIAYATGIKLAKPDLKVIVLVGDGDGAAIGGNHLIHAARRNIDMTVLCFNNQVYGMTSGQYSPLTPLGTITSTTPQGHREPSFDLCKLVEGAGGTFIARGTAYHTSLLIKLLAEGLQHQGFSFIEGISQCPTYFGRKNKRGGPLEMLEWMKEHAVPVHKADGTPEQFVIGKLLQRHAPEFIAEYAKNRGGKVDEDSNTPFR